MSGFIRYKKNCWAYIVKNLSNIVKLFASKKCFHTPDKQVLFNKPVTRTFIFYSTYVYFLSEYKKLYFIIVQGF